MTDIAHFPRPGQNYPYVLFFQQVITNNILEIIWHCFPEKYPKKYANNTMRKFFWIENESPRFGDTTSNKDGVLKERNRAK